MLSKRVLTELVRDGHVNGWDDPRMPTLAGLRRRGVPPAAIRDFVKRIGVAKANSVVDVGMLEFSIREELNKTALRRMAVLRPLKVVIENYPEGQGEELDAVNHPDDPAAGSRKIPFGRELYIERDDFMENPPKKFFRLSPGRGGAAALRLFHHLPRGGEERGRRGGRAALHLRSGDPRRQRAGRPQGARRRIHWVSAARCDAGRGAPLQSAVHQARSDAAARLRRRPQSEFAGSAERRPRRAGAGRRAIRASRCSSSGRAISCAIRIRPPAARCSIAPSDCVIHSPRRSHEVDQWVRWWFLTSFRQVCSGGVLSRKWTAASALSRCYREPAVAVHHRL